MSDPIPRIEQPEEQLRYASLLEWSTRVGLLVLALSFAAYVSGLTPSFVPMDRLPALWSLPVGRFLAETGMPTGWGWVAHLGHGDVQGLAGIVILAGCSVPCLLALVPVYAARRDHAFVAVCLAVVAVVVLAASGLLSGGH
jgi:hypothetical protein